MMQPLTRSDEWRRYWPLVLAAFLGLSLTSVASISSGVFIGPIDQEFNWIRTEISAGFTLASLITIPLSPVVGAMIDRFGSRRIVLPGILLTAMAFAALSFADGSFSQWMVLWFIYGLAALLIQPTVWAAAISSTFNAGRSLALSLALSGMSMALIVVPPLTEWLISSFGWRSAYIWLAATFGIPALVMSFFFLYSAKDRQRLMRSSQSGVGQPGQMSATVEPAQEGLSIAEAIRSLALYRIAGAALITLLFSAAFLVHQFPILTESGVSRHNAALLASLAGAGSIVGKLVTGWLMDRFDGGLIGCITNSVMAIGMLLLLEPFRTPATIVLAMLIIGYSNGAKLQICAFLTSVYGGMRNYGKIFGVMVSIMAGAGGLGPLVGGVIYDLAGGYNPLIIAGIPSSLVAGLLLFRLGRYPHWNRPLETRGRV